MARHVIEEGYVFNPSTQQITVTAKYIRPEQLMLITNVTRGTVLYNFSDPALGYTALTNAANTQSGMQSTVITLAYNTAAQSSTDKIAILYEETNELMYPAEVMKDSVNKLKTSTPQAMIDTDFEYGTQPTKWESIN